MKALDPGSSARTGALHTDRGNLPTPLFIPIGTYGAVKTLSSRDLDESGASIILGNAYHLYLRPGVETIRNAGGLHRFMAWNKPILTDSGGFQVFSLAQLREITDEGVVFKSTLDGSEHEMTPEKSMEIQRALGSDIVMAFDECPPGDAPMDYVRKTVKRTGRWAIRCADYLANSLETYGTEQAFFPIVQGGVWENLRKESVQELHPLMNTGVAVGGLAVGEEKSAMFDMVSLMDELLPRDKVRYLMGVGKPEDIVRAIDRGMDMFDCVIPTRNARNGQLLTWNGVLNINNERYKHDFSPVEERCSCYGCQTVTRAYLRHLFNLNEILGLHLASLHNVTFYLTLLAEIRTEIEKGAFSSWSKTFLSSVREKDDD